MAILSHIITRNDQSVQHRYCPVVLESWCGWQRNEDVKKSGLKGTTTQNPNESVNSRCVDILS